MIDRRACNLVVTLIQPVKSFLCQVGTMNDNVLPAEHKSVHASGTKEYHARGQRSPIACLSHVAYIALFCSKRPD